MINYVLTPDWVPLKELHPTANRVCDQIAHLPRLYARPSYTTFPVSIHGASDARLRRAVNARGHFPTEQAALRCLYLTVMSLDPTGQGRKRWTNPWKAALNAFDGRPSAGRK
jgi:hypothetical protein